MFSSRGTVRYEERGQGYRDVEKVGKHWSNIMCILGGRREALCAYGNTEALSHLLLLPQKSKNMSACFRLSYPVA